MTENPPPIVTNGASQSDLTAAKTIALAGLRPLVLEAWLRTARARLSYFDSLRAFAPARFSQHAGPPPVAYASGALTATG